MAGQRHREERARGHTQQAQPERRLRDPEVVLQPRDVRDPRSDHRAVDREDRERRQARRHTATTSMPALVYGRVSSPLPSVTRWSMSASRATTHGYAVRSLSAVASAITSPAEATIARFTYASSASGVVTPTSGWREQMPSTQMSARTM